ncbi:unnamed protein product [Prorocentrum cordatum]|uniref:Uncharacterized protein n=1 Tax=Prorocentrum cordatum TaxID=2364126 RepID=A0ABN9TQ81_9DINO|nr:unnamed protein product [Polarella glacialis]
MRRGCRSILWSTEWRQLQHSVVDAFTTKPAVLRAADSVWQASQVIEVMEEVEVSTRVLFYLQRYASQRVLVFADRPKALESSLPSWVLSDPLATAQNGQGRVQVVSNDVPWDSGGLFDVVLHASAPPNRGEFHRRLGSCRQLAVALLATVPRGGSTRLSDAWLSFAEYAQSSVVGEDAELLRRLASEGDQVEARVSDLEQLTSEIAKREAKSDNDWDAFRDGVGADLAWDDWGGSHAAF